MIPCVCGCSWPPSPRSASGPARRRTCHWRARMWSGPPPPPPPPPPPRSPRPPRDRHTDAAEDVYELDGSDAVMRRMVSTCGLTETTSVDGWWSRTGVSARDAVRLGACVADGRAAGPQWTDWLLGQMRQVRG